jgi:hypothetical protein
MKTSKTILLATLLTLGLGCGYSAKSTTPAVAGTMPTISALAPSSVTAGSPSFVLTVNGTNFNGNAAINLNGTAQMTSHVSANQLTATVPAASVATAGTVTVTVTNPGTAGGIYGGGTAAETSNSMTFTIN